MQREKSTSYGKFLKRLRIDTNETLASMAQRLEVSVSFLSSIESGIREIPPDFSNKIRTEYKLNAEASDALLKAEIETNHKSISISLGSHEDDKEYRKAVLSISRDLQELELPEIKEIAEKIHQKAQKKRNEDFSIWKGLGAAVIITLGVGIALSISSSNKNTKEKNLDKK